MMKSFKQFLIETNMEVEDRLDEAFQHDVDHMPGRRIGLSSVNKTRQFTVATNAIGDNKEQRAEVEATSDTHAKNLALEIFTKRGLKPRVHFDGLRVLKRGK